jgi:hypothetical protein
MVVRQRTEASGAATDWSEHQKNAAKAAPK